MSGKARNGNGKINGKWKHIFPNLKIKHGRVEILAVAYAMLCCAVNQEIMCKIMVMSDSVCVISSRAIMVIR